jgi:hypothetical protein
VYVTVMSALSYGTIRFRIPAEVAIVVLAAVTLVWLWDALRGRHDPGLFVRSEAL